jgi:glycosyltransferase involved in cell wall biosynthesis
MERVLQVVTDMNMGGIETLIMSYYRKMDRSKVQFDFLMHRSAPSHFDQEILDMGGRIYRLPPIHPKTFVAYRRELKKFFDTHQYRVVHAHNNAYSMFVLREAQRHGVPVRIASSHCAFPKLDLLRQLTYDYCRSKINRYATHRLACSIPAGQWLYSGADFQILLNAIETADFTPNSAYREEVRAALELGDDFTVIHVGRLTSAKNHEFLLDAFRELLNTEPSAKLVLVGDGELRSEVEAKAAGLPVGSVLLLGTRTDIPRLLQAADVFAFPSRFEGLPVTMIEAQAAGLPCVMSDRVTGECVVTDLVTSLPIDDPKRWAEEILAKKHTPRTDRLADIQRSGYDITAAAEKLTRFYLNGETL